jgi:hypothetical protein
VKNKLTNAQQIIKNESTQFLQFLKGTFPLFHNSNFFVRDYQYGIKRYLEKKDIFISIAESEKITEQTKDYFESEGIFIKVNDNTWRINFPEFVTQTPGDPL